MRARQPPAGERAPDRGEPRPLPPRRRRRAAGQPGLSDRCRASAAQPHGAGHLCAPLRHGPDRCAGRNAAACERGVVFGRISEPAHAFRARHAAGPALGHLHHVFRRHDRAALAPAAGISGRHGACRRVHRADGALCHRRPGHRSPPDHAHGAKRLRHPPAGRCELPLPPHDEGLCRAGVRRAAGANAPCVSRPLRRVVRSARAVSARAGRLPEGRGL